MENAKELIIQSISVILFVFAVTMLLGQVEEYRHTLQIVKKNYQQTNEALQTGADNAPVNISYEEVLSSLFCRLEYDVEINDLLISKYDHTIDLIDDYHIEHTDYIKSYFYDSNGDITRIIYKSIEG